MAFGFLECNTVSLPCRLFFLDWSNQVQTRKHWLFFFDGIRKLRAKWWTLFFSMIHDLLHFHSSVGKCGLNSGENPNPKGRLRHDLCSTVLKIAKTQNGSEGWRRPPAVGKKRSYVFPRVVSFISFIMVKNCDADFRQVPPHHSSFLDFLRGRVFNFPHLMPQRWVANRHEILWGHLPCETCKKWHTLPTQRNQHVCL